MEPESKEPIYLESDKIYLTPFTRQHLENNNYLKWLNNLNTTKHLGLPDYMMPVSFKDLENYFEQNAFSRNNVLLAVIERETLEFIGTVRLAHINWISRVAVIGIMLGDDEKRGLGYASEMTKLIVDYAFNTLNLHKLTASAHNANLPSLKCFQRLGYIYAHDKGWGAPHRLYRSKSPQVNSA